MNYPIIQFVQDHIDISLNLHLLPHVHLEVFHNYYSMLIIHFQLFSNVVHVQNILHLNIDVLFHRNENLVEFDVNDLLSLITNDEKKKLKTN